MKQRHLAGLAAILVGATGAVAFGDHHATGSLPDCSFAPAHCTAECASLYSCLASPAGGFVECASESSAYESCRRLPPPIGPGNPGGIIIRPPSCPPGQHLTEGGQCHADHECGDDEIGGGSEECEPCGEGKVPNDDRTACLSCEWGELPGEPGRCSCDYAAVDLVAKPSLLAVPQNPWEHVEQYQCSVGHVIVGTSTLSSANEDDVCVWEFPEDYLESTAVAFGHSHPHFHWQNDEGTLCDGTRLSAGEILNMTSTNYKFSDYDRRLAERWNLPLYLVSTSWGRVSVYRKDGSGQWAEEEI